MISQLGYIGIGVKDMAVWEDFVTNVLGLEISERLDDGTLYLRQDEYHHRFIVEPTGEDDIKYAGWMVNTLDSMNEVQARLQAAGVEVEEASPEECAYRKVVKMITFKDPDGVRVEVFYGLDVVVEEPFHSPRPIGNFHAGELGLGHIVFGTNDIEETERFYRDILGFRVSDYQITERDGQKFKMCFFHVNGRHHSLALGSMKPTTRHLNHWMMQAEQMDDVGRTYDLVRARGIPLRNAIGKHMNDHMLSFYMLSPSGFAVEFGAGAREVDDDNWVVQLHHVGSVWGHDRGPAMGGGAPFPEMQEQQESLTDSGVKAR